MISSKTQEIPLSSAAKRIRLSGVCGEIAEIRLRVGRRAVAVTTDGNMVQCSEPFSSADIAECFSELCRYSVHSYAREISEGFITLDGGHRVGICGTAVSSGGRIEALRDISSLNIRIAHEVKGCAEELYERCLSTELRSLILAGKPLSGKTTVLRDLARILSEHYKVTIIDGRNEFSGTVGGVPTLDVGENTDVLCGADKLSGIMLALRALSPDVIVCDEIGDDYEAVEQCLYCGVKLIVSAHAANLWELERRRGVGELLTMFDCAAVLGKKGSVEQVRFIQPLSGRESDSQ
jgi:stage III sporulation protein AA